jgi:hypothetical protein
MEEAGIEQLWQRQVAEVLRFAQDDKDSVGMIEIGEF